MLIGQRTINAFALPGGQIFVARAMLDALESERQIAAALAHKIVHILARNSAERIAEAQLPERLTGALVRSTYDPDNPASMRTTQVAALIIQLVQIK